MNTITIHGNLTDRPDLYMSEQGKAVLSLSIAVNRRRFDRQVNEWVDAGTVYHRVVAFGALAENAANLPGGALVTVTGEFADNSFIPEGETKRVTRIQLVAEDIAPSLRYATVAITKNAKREPATANA